MYLSPVPLTAVHDLSEFDCGNSAINTWLRKRALKNEESGATRTFVVCEKDSNRVVAFVGLTVGGISRKEVTVKLKRNMPDSVPVAIIGRLGVDLNHSGQGIGQDMVFEGLRQAMAASVHAGMAAVLVIAKNPRAAAWYEEIGFTPLADDPLRLVIRLEDAKATFPELEGLGEYLEL
ncbi:MAG TPA: GNAT family N-acetyltransferase [Alphaproteobacteria bacterium]|nr:GNAT family N-acetyltransferase [Alphaproteobacteria bacterium]MDP6272007.1 GNAT family N-acetyltransferase [Alphaproteobacteria bacterium]HJM49529.1 GNAT family N-acetyltransferase [Alphaproteobacteria bacterium]